MLQIRHRPFGSGINFYFSSGEKVLDSPDSDGPSKKLTPVLAVRRDPGTPPSNEEIYAMLKELDNKEEP
nr:MAG: ORF3 [Torque teno polar bear virus 10]